MEERLLVTRGTLSCRILENQLAMKLFLAIPAAAVHNAIAWNKLHPQTQETFMFFGDVLLPRIRGLVSPAMQATDAGCVSC